MNIQLSANEWKLMELLWDYEPQTITQLTALVQPDPGWSKHTIITMLNRLETKGAVLYEEGGRARLYRTCIPRSEAALQETETLLQKVYGGSLGMLVNSLVEQKGISRAEREQLMAILKRAEKDEEA